MKKQKVFKLTMNGETLIEPLVSNVNYLIQEQIDSLELNKPLSITIEETEMTENEYCDLPQLDGSEI